MFVGIDIWLFKCMINTYRKLTHPIVPPPLQGGGGPGGNDGPLLPIITLPPASYPFLYPIEQTISMERWMQLRINQNDWQRIPWSNYFNIPTNEQYIWIISVTHDFTDPYIPYDPINVTAVSWTGNVYKNNIYEYTINGPIYDSLDNPLMLWEGINSPDYYAPAIEGSSYYF